MRVHRPRKVSCVLAADDQDGLRLCYLRHAYGLGEHYNSVKAATCTGEDNNSEADDSADL